MNQPTQEPEAMPIQSDHNLTVCRVMQDHGITQDALAARCGLSQSTISRVCSGSLAVTPPITQALWALTKDTRILQVAIGSPDAVVLDPELVNLDSAFNERIDQASCLVACHELASFIALLSLKPNTADADSATGVQVIDRLLGRALAMRQRLARNEHIPFTHQQARRLADPITA